MTREHILMNEIMIALSPYGSVFRMNAGDFWQGKRVYSKEFSQNVLVDLRRIQGLPRGFSDLLFVGKDGTVAFLEVKTDAGKPTEEQLKFIEHMKKSGYKAAVVRSTDDALNLIKTQKKE